MTEQLYDIIIIGGGPIGLACGLEAKKAGLHYLIIEKGTLVNSLYNYPVNMTFFSTSERLEIGGIPFVSNNAKPTRNEGLEYYRRVSVSGGVHIKLFEEVLDVKKRNTGFKVISSKIFKAGVWIYCNNHATNCLYRLSSKYFLKKFSFCTYKRRSYYLFYSRPRSEFATSLLI